MAKIRLDVLLWERGLVASRSKAKQEIEAGRVWIGDRRAGKPSEQFDDDAPVEIRNRAYPWVSRGGVKLAHALDGFNVSVEGKTVLDIGASTGGFTHVCLTRGASRIYAVDVGTEQLAPQLRQERRVVSLEGTDCRALSRTLIKDPIELIVCDVSFIGLETALPVPLSLAEPGCGIGCPREAPVRSRPGAPSQVRRCR